MASIQKKNDRYYVVAWIDGRQKWLSAGKRKKEAVALKLQIETELSTGTHVIQDLTLYEVAEEWLDSIEHTVKKPTLTAYQSTTQHLIDGLGGGALIKNVRAKDVEAYLSEAIGRHSSTTVGYQLRELRRICQWAIQRGYLVRDPTIGIKKPRKVLREVEVLSGKEIRGLLDHAIGQTKLVAMVALYTGLRASEICALRWGDIDGGKLRVARSYSHTEGRMDSTKSRASKRTVIIPQVLSSALEAVRGTHSNLVFTNEAGSPLDWNNFRHRQWRPLIEAAGLRANITPHILRHTYASLLIESGENPKFIQHQLGHSSINVTFDTYGHLMPGASEEAAGRIDKAFSGLLEEC